MNIFGDQAHLVLDLFGVFFFAVTGAMLAARKGFDVVASFLLAALTGLGGGAVRDVLIGADPPAALEQPLYLAPVLVAAVIVYFFYPHVSRFSQTLLLFDAGGLGLFCVTGTIKALDFDVPMVSAIALGVLSAVGGGLIRDVVAREVPSLFRFDDIYALPAVVGAVVAATLWATDVLSPVTGVAAAALTFGLRVAALHYGWRAPLAHRHRSVP